MSQFSKVNSTLRANIITSLTNSSKCNMGLRYSDIANPGGKFSLRAIQEATQKMKADGTLTSYKGQAGVTYYKIAPSTSPIKPEPLTMSASV